MAQSPSMLIIGAGYLGTETARRAVHAGYSKVILGRRQPRPLPACQTISIDVTAPTTLATLPEVDVVVYAVSAEDRSPKAYDDAYRDGLNNVLSHISTWAKMPRVIFVSSTSVYAEDGGGWVSEESQNLTSIGPSASLVQGERLLIQRGIPFSILRFGGIYGPGRLYLINRVKAGAERLFQGEVLYLNRIHRDDGANAILHIAQDPKCASRIFNIVDDAPANRNEVILWLHQKLELKKPLEESQEETLLPTRGNKRCSNQALKETGFNFTYPTYCEGYSSIIQDLSYKGPSQSQC